MALNESITSFPERVLPHDVNRPILHRDLEKTLVQNDQQIDEILANEMNKLSVGERQKIYEEIHGVHQLVKETPELIQEKLNALEYELSKISNKNAYDLAIQRQKELNGLHSDYVTSKKYRLMFLRSERFDAAKAAKRMVLFMEGKLELYGPDVLTRPILYNDLSKEDLACLQSGWMHVLPIRDKAGRAIVADFYNLLPPMPHIPMLRTLFYIMQCAGEDEETQRRGMIAMMYFVGSKPKGENNFSSDFMIHFKGTKMMSMFPFRACCVHLCSDDVKVKMMKSVLVSAMGENGTRLRIHTGTHTECQYSLMTFGFPVHALPVTLSGELKTSTHMKWLHRRKVRDSAMSKNQQKSLYHMNGMNRSSIPSLLVFERIDLPGIHDVLLGRGKGGQDHDGNGRLRYIVSVALKDFLATPIGQGKRRQIAKNIIEYIRVDFNGRFLKRNSDGWYQFATEEETVEKVMNVFRTERQSRPTLESFMPAEGSNIADAKLDESSFDIRTLLGKVSPEQPNKTTADFTSSPSSGFRDTSKRLKSKGQRSSASVDVGRSCFSFCYGTGSGAKPFH